MLQFTADDFEVTTDDEGRVNISLYPDRPDSDGPADARLTLTISDAEDFARILFDRILAIRSRRGESPTYVDVQTGTFGPATGIRFVSGADGADLSEMSDNEIIEFGEEHGW